MERRFHRKFQLWAMGLCLAILSATAPLAIHGQSSSVDNQPFELRSSIGDMHLGSDADPREVGLPVYPGARLKHEDKDGNSANLSILTSAFGMKLVLVNFESDDSPDKILDFYRGKLKKYGKVIECRTSSKDDGPHFQVHENSKELKCEGDGQGDNVELKAGTEDNQHTVAVEPSKSGHGSTFALVYVRTRGKQADI